MALKDVGNKVPIYKLKTTNEVMKYYDEWGEQNKYNKDMVEWNYTGPQETVKVFKKYEQNKDALIFDAGCGTGLVALELKKFSDKIGINFVCSAFYPEAVDFLKLNGVKEFKIASRTCLQKDPFSKETLNAISKTKKPVYISMGMGGNKKTIEKIFQNNKKIFCYCISEYPLDFKKINWKKAIKFDGFSDHTIGITSSIVFATLKNLEGTKEIMIEKHVKLKNSKGPDASTSITVEKLADMIRHLRLIEKSKLN